MCPRCKTGTATPRLVFCNCVKLDHHWGFIGDRTKNTTRVDLPPKGHISIFVGDKAKSTIKQNGLNSCNEMRRSEPGRPVVVFPNFLN